MEEETAIVRFDKIAWQRENRRRFKHIHGFSYSAHYATGKLRQAVLERDNYTCVGCGMTDVEHKKKWNRPITIDHRNKNRMENTFENLQTLCLRCHGKKDITPYLRIQRIPPLKTEIMELRRMGTTYQAIADCLGFSVGGIYKWVSRWEGVR